MDTTSPAPGLLGRLTDSGRIGGHGTPPPAPPEDDTDDSEATDGEC